MYSPRYFQEIRDHIKCKTRLFSKHAKQQDKGLMPVNPKYYDIDAILSRAHQHWEKVCEDLPSAASNRKRSLGRKSNFLIDQSWAFSELWLY